MRTIGILSLCLALAAASACAAEEAPAAPDVLELKSGERVEGRIVNETEFAYFVAIEGGEQRGIAKTRVKSLKRGAAPAAQPVAEPKAEAPQTPAPPAANPPAGNVPLFPPVKEAPEADELQALVAQLKDLGAPQRDLRAAALKRANDLGFRAVPVLLAMLRPENKQPPELRMGALRALTDLGPLDAQGAVTLGWAAMMEPDPEVRREAARTIRALKEDRAVEWILQFAVRDDARYRTPAALALREINDDRAFATLAGLIPMPTVNAANPGNGPTEIRRVDLPIGPHGTRMPIHLPTSDVIGTVENATSPPAEALKVIAQKDIGSLPGVWIAWLNEKVGTWTREERERSRKESLVNKIGNPHTGQ